MIIVWTLCSSMPYLMCNNTLEVDCIQDRWHNNLIPNGLHKDG